MGTRITDGGSNRLWKDYTQGGATGKGTYIVGDELMRLDAAMCSSRIVLTPINDFATPGASATAQWSLDGVYWFPLPYSVQGGPKVATGVFALGTRQALILPDLGNFFRVIANTAGAFADPTANNLVAGLTEDDGLQFSPDAGAAGGTGTTGTTTVADAGSPDAAAGIRPVSSTVAASSLVVKAAAGNLYAINAVSGATAGYLMLFDSATVPADGVVQPKWSIPLAANTGYSGAPGGTAVGMGFANGITAVFSSTGPFLKTASATAFLSGCAR